MFCGKCGTRLEDSARFCTACGAEVQAAQSTVAVKEAAEEPRQTLPEEKIQVKAGASKNFKFKRPALIGVSALVVVALAAGGAAALLGKGGTADTIIDSREKVVSTKWDIQNEAYIQLHDGSLYDLGPERSGRLSPDGKHVVCRDKDGQLSLIDLGTQEETEISDGVSLWLDVTNDTLSYVTFDGDLHRYQISTCQDIEVAHVDDVSSLYSPNSCVGGNVYAYDKSKGFVSLTVDSDEPQVISPARSDSVRILDITEDGDSVLWTEYTEHGDEGTENIMLYQDGEVSKVCSFEDEAVWDPTFGYSGPGAEAVGVLSESGWVCVSNWYKDTLYYKAPGEEARMTHLGGELRNSQLEEAGSSAGLFKLDSRENIEGVYVPVGRYQDWTLTYIDFETGDRKSIVNDVFSWVLSGDGKTIAYTVGSDRELYVTDAKGLDTNAGFYVGSYADSLVFSRDGHYVFYLQTDVPEEKYAPNGSIIKGIGDLYCCSVETGDTVLVTDDVASVLEPGAGDDELLFLSDASTSHITTGTLTTYSAESGRLESICQDVPVILSAGYNHYDVREGLYFFTHSGTIPGDGYESFYGDWKVYKDGKVIDLAQDIRIGSWSEPRG